ncbi:MAG: cell division protein FtsL [Proteobacteria bacterium]|jgi:cell division protein FtsL|nr:cell division protein FtsL [Alphaproteobacteria bacterium]NCC02839.1 cell division protein FtsL [Pseudomonadota bacterium]
MTRALLSAIWLSLTIVVSLGLYHTSYRVEDLSKRLKTLNAHIQNEQQSIHVLRAEWVYLSNPARIEKAARKHLDLQPTTPDQIAKLNKISALIPSRGEAATRLAIAERNQALSRRHAAAHTPKIAASENDRLNTRLLFHREATAQQDIESSTAIWSGNELALASPSPTR